MLGIGNVLPSTAGLLSGNGGKKSLLDLAFRDACLWMEHSTLLTSNYANKFSLPLPLLGFSFEPPESFTLLKYQFAQYPYLNKVAVANAFIKQSCPLTIRGVRPLTIKNNLITTYLTNHAGIKYYIEKYCDKGGTWAINTMWGIYTGLILQSCRPKQSVIAI